MKNQINSCFIHLVDFERTKDWYKEVLGFEVEAEGEGFLQFKLEGPPLILLQAKGKEITPLPYSPFFFETDDVKETQKELREKNVNVGEIEHFGSKMYGCHFLILSQYQRSPYCYM
ncbi:VOC family protein [Halobacillus karajensis]|uniref:Glyoxalase-like domain protein n=1 Tax=Halobacillus karajensis TaxID=195088 RepID=A0A024P7M2_9BACI|nr:VOC family protein [Halobacillus karajensis]CDQ25124.1 Glyoxalase-like domain protein [Halobacillus karajensis]